MADGGRTFDAFGHQQASRAQPKDPRALPRLVRNGIGLAQVISGLLSSAALGFALVLLAPLLLPALVLAALPMAVLSRRSGRLEFTFISRQTPALRVRDYLQTVLTGRDEAQEIRAFDL